MLKPFLRSAGRGYLNGCRPDAAIGPLAQSGTVLFGFKPDTQRYFDYHHTAADRFEAVNKRELSLEAASMAALTYLIHQHGV